VTAHAVKLSLVAFVLAAILLWSLSALVAFGLRYAPVRRGLSRPLAGRLMLGCLSALLPLLFAELMLRPFTVAHVPPKTTTTFIKDDVLGWRLRPRASDTYRGIVYAVNSKGVRGPELPYERRDASAKRILYLGDSVTAGFGLPVEQSYPYMVEAIAERRGLSIETVNAGVDGYSPWQYALSLQREGIRYQPDLVVIGFVLNDVTEKFSLVRFGGSGAGVQLGISYYSFDDWLRHHSGLYVWLDKLRTRLHGGRDMQAHAVHQEKLNVRDLVKKADSERVRHAWEVTLDEMNGIVESCRSRQLPLAIVIFPYKFQFSDPETQGGPQATLAEFAQERGIPCLDLFPLLQAHVESEHLSVETLFLDNVHPSAEGSAVVSRFIADFLLQGLNEQSGVSEPNREAPHDRASQADVKLVGGATLAIPLSGVMAQPIRKPNFIVIFTDDQGYNDLGCFGSKTIRTPNVDQLAREGRRFTSFYVASSVCSPSRAALLTGCYPKRIGMEKHVLFPQDNKGMHKDEVTIADMLKTAGYATACIGKWHLGHRTPFLPTSQGFDSYFGIPYSNDMNHPDNKGKPRAPMDQSWLNQDKMVKQWKTPLMQDEEIIECPVNQRTITRRYTDKAIEFITTNKENPFFLYLPHNMPHVPLFVPKDAYDPDPKHAYKAVIEHIDAEVGRLIKAVKTLGLSESTYIIFTSDNGPWLKYKHHGGCAKPLRDGKGTSYEGGQRVPCIICGPGIPAGTETAAMATTLDLFPTIARLAGVEAKPRGPIDGLDISALIKGSNDSPRNEFIYYAAHGDLEGMRQGDWKFLQKQSKKPELYNLADDIGETVNLARKHRRKAKALKARMKKLDAEMTKNIRPQGIFTPSVAWGDSP
jgi:arylsulfatase A